MNEKNLYVHKRELEALQKKVDQANSSLNSYQRNFKKNQKKLALYSNQCLVIAAKLNAMYKELSNKKMLAERTNNMTDRTKFFAQMEIVDQIRKMITQKISICQ